ncbi:lytic transglycosylase domain-containing protein [Streptomyces qinzhouensis]|uniref:Lytic transglycosylase domain-containing protein n=1 Tax=Streptomyces qinzhouensis TaxID=2599401 RepID=A0A5B8J4Q9_9ACTN|nr:lytic transglycosylase domain-containing protein [Streptomyces qinzhouensis]
MAARFGRRLRRGATTTAVAAAAVAALSASQAPSVTHAVSGDSHGAQDDVTEDVTPPPGTPVSGDSPYYTDLPPLKSPTPTGSTPATGATTGGNSPTGAAEAGIPVTVLAAYKRAEETIASSDPGCKVPWQLLAAIGKVESGQARGGKVDANGTTLSPIRGPVLNGVGFANIPDTDNGAYDADTVYDRAVGPMQFIPSTWATWGQDANGDGRKDPNNIYDAALAAGRYLCANDRDLTNAGDLEKAILGYNRSRAYLNTVLSWFEYYKKGTHQVPDGSGVQPGSNTPDSGSGNNGYNNGGTGHGSTPPSPGTGGPAKEPAQPGGKPPGKTPPSGPGAKPPQKPKPPTTPPAKPAPVPAVENAGTGALTAMAGRDIQERVTVRVKTEGRPTAGQEVRFEISGPTATVFAGGKRTAVLRTAADGTVTAPVLEAGDRTGAFIVRATTVGPTPTTVGFRGKVTARAADKVVRADDKELTAAPDTPFADRIAVKATYRDTVAAGVAAGATLLVTGPDGELVPADKGPYFKGADGSPLRTLTGLTTAADGTLTLPELYADDLTGTFYLKLTLAGGVGLTLELKVATAPAPTSSPGTPATATGH